MNLQILLYNVEGLVSLLIIPIAGHLIIYRRSLSFKHIMISIFISNYVLVGLMLVLGLAGLFYIWLLLPLALILFYLLGLILRKLSWIDLAEGTQFSKMHLVILLCLIAFLLFQSQLLPHDFSADTYGKYLGNAREISSEHKIPSVNLDTLEHSHISRPPIAMLYNAYIFSLLHPDEQLARGMPIYFTILTLILLMAWGYEEKGKDASIVVPVVVLGSIYFWKTSLAVMQEPSLLFFCTLSFYCLNKYLTDRCLLHLIALIGSLTLGLLSKDSMLLVSGLIFVSLFFFSNTKKEPVSIIGYGLLFSFPVLLWYSKNYYIWGNPVFPLFDNIFKSKLYEYTSLSSKITSPILKANAVPLSRFLSQFVTTFPLFALWGLYSVRNWRKGYIKIISITFSLTLIYLMVSGMRWLPRYLSHFVGVYAVCAGIELARLKEQLLSNIKWKFILVPACLLVAVGLSIHRHQLPDYYEVKKYRFKAMEYFEEHAQNKKEIRFLGDETLGLANWYSKSGKKYIAFRFHDLNFIKATNGDFNLSENSSYFYQKLKGIGIEYIFSAHRKKVYTQTNFWEVIEEDKEHFKLVFDDYGAKIWKLVENF